MKTTTTPAARPPAPRSQYRGAFSRVLRGGAALAVPALAVALMLVLSACGSQPIEPAGPVDTTGAEDATMTSTVPTAGGLDGAWQLTEGHGPGGPVPVLPEAPITLVVDGSQWGGTAACNSYGGTVDVDDDGSLTMDGFAVTEMACIDDGIMDSEAAFLAALTTVDSVEIVDTALVLEGPDARLAFAAQAEPEPAALVGTEWALESLLEDADGDGAASSPINDATLEITPEGQVVGTAGCNRFHGPGEVDDDVLHAGPLAATRMLCEPAVMDQERHVLDVLQAAPSISLDGNSLTLRTEDGLGLVYRAAP